MMTKNVACPVCQGKGYVVWANKTEASCSLGTKMCPHCDGTGVREVTLTNGDRIRAMSDEELAEWNNFCPHIDDECTLKGCTKCILEWLKQPVED